MIYQCINVFVFNSSIADQEEEEDIFKELRNHCSEKYKRIVDRGIESYDDWTSKFVFNGETKVSWQIDLSKYVAEDGEVKIPGVDDCLDDDNWFSGKGEIFQIICRKFDIHN